MTASAPRWVDRPMTEADISQVCEMESLACIHPSHAWTADNYRSSLRAGYWCRVRTAFDTGRVVAVCVAMSGFEEVHLLNIAVSRAWHGQGIARELLSILAARCLDQREHTIWLEVRPSNGPARALYECLGYQRVGERKGYYPAPDGREDAIVMRKDLEGPRSS